MGPLLVISRVVTPFITGTGPPCTFHSLRIRLYVLGKDLNLESYDLGMGLEPKKSYCIRSGGVWIPRDYTGYLIIESLCWLVVIPVP